MAGFATKGLHMVNALIRPFGVALRRLNRPTRDFEDFIKSLDRLGVHFRTVVDVGVAHGTPGLYKALPMARYYLVEPVDEMRPVLERLKSELDADYFLVAAGAEDREVSFFVHDDVSGSSLYKQAEGEVLDGRSRTVTMRRLDTILPTELARPVLLKIDTQGHEIDVLKGAPNLLKQVDLILLEASLMGFRKDAPEIGDVIHAVSEMGFSVYDLLEGHSRALDGALAQVDIAFVPNDSRLRADPRFFSDEQLAGYVAKYAAKK